jgi:hypothetical protein
MIELEATSDPWRKPPQHVVYRLAVTALFQSIPAGKTDRDAILSQAVW